MLLRLATSDYRPIRLLFSACFAITILVLGLLLGFTFSLSFRWMYLLLLIVLVAGLFGEAMARLVEDAIKRRHLGDSE